MIQNRKRCIECGKRKVDSKMSFVKFDILGKGMLHACNEICYNKYLKKLINYSNELNEFLKSNTPF